MRRLPIYGLMAELATEHELLKAAHQAYAAGYRHVDAYSPLPVPGLAEALGFHHTGVPALTLAGGLAGGLGGYWLQYWTSAIDYPLNVASRPFHSWPAFIPVTFEMTILGAALSALVGMFALNHLPMPYHPVFNVPRFAQASRDRFFLCIQATDPLFDRRETARFLEGLPGATVSVVEQ